MHVGVEELAAVQRLEVFEAGLLGDLAQGDGARIGLALAVPARLQPAAEAGMVQQEDAAPAGVEDETAPGEMACELRAQVRVLGMRPEEGADESDVARFLLVGAGVPFQLSVER